MKIISVRNGFTADHSSTSYEFIAVEKALGKKDRAAVSSLSSRADPTSRRVSFIYHADGYDIPGGWEALMEKYYDVMYSESYDVWTLAIAFNTSAEQISELQKYEFTGEDDFGIEVLVQGARVIVIINCRLDNSSRDDSYEDYEDDEEGDEEGDEEDEDEDEDKMLQLLIQIRAQLQQGDYRALYKVWEKYNSEDEADEEIMATPSVPPEKPQGEKIIKQFSGMLE